MADAGEPAVKLNTAEDADFYNGIDYFIGNVSRHSALMLAATGLSGALSFLFKILMSRMLPIEDFSAYYTLVSFFTIFSVPALTLEMSVSRMVSRLNAKKDYPKIASRLKSVLKRIAYIIVPGFLFILPAVFPLSGILKLSDPAPVYLTFASLLLFLPLNAGYGGLQGLQKFRWWAFILTAVGLIRLGAGTVLVFFGHGVGGAVAGSLISILAGFILVLYPLKFLKGADPSPERISVQIPGLGRIFPALLLTVYLGFGDMLLVQYFFTPPEAAVFGAASILGRGVFYIALPVSMALYPKASYARSRKISPGPVLHNSVFIFLITSFAFSALLFGVSEFVAGMLFPREYAEAAGLIRFFGFAFMPMGLNLVIVQYSLALQRRKFLPLLFLAALIHFILIALFHSSPENVLVCLFVSGCAGTVLLWPGAGKVKSSPQV